MGLDWKPSIKGYELAMRGTYAVAQIRNATGSAEETETWEWCILLSTSTYIGTRGTAASAALAKLAAGAAWRELLDALDLAERTPTLDDAMAE